MSTLSDKSLDLTFLLNAGFLNEVGFGLYTLHLRFAALHIVVNSPCEVIAPDRKVTVWQPERDMGDLRIFKPFLVSKIQSYRITPRPDLLLLFSNGWELALIDRQDGYESFVLWTNDGRCLPVI